ncbi:hypothetical protein [Streptomyces sp. JNUCC 63]
MSTAGVGQPRQWTLLDFAAEELAEQMAANLAPMGGWYVNYNTTTEPDSTGVTPR